LHRQQLLSVEECRSHPKFTKQIKAGNTPFVVLLHLLPAENFSYASGSNKTMVSAQAVLVCSGID